MSTARETALSALDAALRTALESLSPPVTVGKRNSTIPEPAEATVSGAAQVLAAMKDGDAAEPVALLGDPPIYDHAQGAILELVAIHPDPETRDAAFDAALLKVVETLRDAPTLDGACDYAQPHPPTTSLIGDTDAPLGKAAELTIELLFSSDSPIG